MPETDVLTDINSESRSRRFLGASDGTQARLSAMQVRRSSTAWPRTCTDAKPATIRFAIFTRTYLGELRIPIKEVSHLLYLFTLGVPTYRARRYDRCGLKTKQRAYTVFRRAIYNASLTHLKRLSGEIELNEALSGGARKVKRVWCAAGKSMVFGLLERSGQVLTFSISSQGCRVLIPSVKEHTKPGSLYYTDDYHAYTSLHLRGAHVVVSKKEGRPKGRDQMNGIEGFWSYAKHWFIS